MRYETRERNRRVVAAAKHLDLYNAADAKISRLSDPAGEPGRIVDAEHALAFMLAGNATVTFVSKKTGARYTYKIQKPHDDKQKPFPFNKGASSSPVYFVKLLTGPDNNANYQYMGVIRDNVFRLTKKSKMTNDATSVKAFGFAFQFLLREKRVPDTMEIWHEGRCGRCGRKLTVPESIANGIGPECAAQMGGV